MKQIFFLLSFILTGITFGKNDKWAAINEAGDVQFELSANFVYPFSNGTAKVYKSLFFQSQWVKAFGYIDHTGKEIIPFEYNQAQNFVADVTWVRRMDELKYSLIDKKGNVIPTKEYRKVGTFYSFQKDICAVYKDGKMGFVNAAGKEVIPCKYVGSPFFVNGLASVALADNPKKFGFINKKGKCVIPFVYDQSEESNFQDGFAIANVNDKTVLIDQNGKVIFKTKKGTIQSVGFGLVGLSDTKAKKGWVNFNNRFVIDPVYDEATPFNRDGFSIVEKNGLLGLIDTTGREVLPCKYDMIQCDLSLDGYILGVYPNEKITSFAAAKKDYFDKQLNPITLEEGVSYINGAKGGSLMSYEAEYGLLGYLNREFNVVIPAQYERAFPFSEGLAWVK